MCRHIGCFRRLTQLCKVNTEKSQTEHGSFGTRCISVHNRISAMHGFILSSTDSFEHLGNNKCIKSCRVSFNSTVVARLINFFLHRQKTHLTKISLLNSISRSHECINIENNIAWNWIANKMRKFATRTNHLNRNV